MVASPAKPEVGEGGLNECQSDAADVFNAGVVSYRTDCQ
jgi:hypothetical protein